ncbi:hypothetical protein GCM10010344_68090 [Streptomyces bluensis]|nr:hypothetical protein GCM10010344_68090 [Streptomyces bluensis]
MNPTPSPADPDAWNAYLAEGNAQQARKRVAADMLLRDSSGRVLLGESGLQARWGSSRRYGRGERAAGGDGGAGAAGGPRRTGCGGG